MKSFFSYFLLCSFLLVSISCKEDFLDRGPTGSVDAGAAYATTGNALAAINGVYRSVVVRYQSSQGHTGHPHMMIITDALGEDYVMGTTNSGWHFNEQRWVSHRSDVSVLTEFAFEMYYRVIANVNLAIANIDNAVGPEEERNQVKGEAFALRAWAYFNLVQLYAKRYVPGQLNTQFGVSMPLIPTTEGLPRSTVDEVYAQINSDIDAAIGLLTSTRQYKSHINLNVAQGIKARVALVQGNWNVAEQYADLAKTGFALMTQAQYQDGFADVSNPEWMWGFDHLEDQSEFFGGYHSYISCNFNSSNIRTCPKAINNLLYNQISATDVRRLMWAPAPTPANSIVPSGGVRVPYMVQKFRLPGTPSTSTMGDTPFMRAAEMYLIQAEAEARQNKDAEAAQTLRSLIVTRDPAYAVSTNIGTALIDEILIHRRIELWGEGFRFTDLKRLNAPLNRNGANHIPSVAVLFDVPAGDVRWEFLLPLDEINNNTNTRQNDLN